ncbi:MAG: MFS transporter [Oscillospiraceae bacterium]
MDEKSLKKYSRNALLGSFVSMLTAGLATMMYSVCLGTIQTELSLTAAQSGSLATYTFMGQMLGGMVAGYIADRIGRKKVLIADVILATGAVFATSFLTSYSIFGLLRFITGVGLGGCYYIASILIGEFVSTDKRGFMSGVSTSVWNFGYVVACVMSSTVLNSIGWRNCFRICALPILAVIFMVFCMKDAPSFTAAKAARDKRDASIGKKENAYAEIWASPKLRSPSSSGPSP